MAAGAFTFYDTAAKIFQGGADLTTNTVKCALVSSAYTFSAAHDEWADASANEISGTNGYTTGGATVGTPVLTAVTNGYKFSSANVTWTASGGSIAAWRRAIFYISGTVEGLTNPVIGTFLGDSTPADVPATTDTNTLTLTVPANGWFDMTHA
jgi:hypothetical protein